MGKYVVLADEAWTHDPELRFWRFYGGAMLRANERERIESDLRDLKAKLGLEGETKWSKLRPFMEDRPLMLLDRFFDYIAAGDIKLRWMWLDQAKQNPAGLTPRHASYRYYILYYLFLVLGFGLPWHDENAVVEIELLADQLPDEPEKRNEFTEFLLSCHKARRYENMSPFQIIDVGEFNSKRHVLAQCIDDVIGAAGFRLNKFHKRTGPNGRRAAGTVYKEQIYTHIRRRLAEIDARERGARHFSFGVNTGTGRGLANRWRDHFRQWDFRKPGIFNSEWLRRNR